MRVTHLPLSILYICMLGSCSPSMENAQCDAVVSYVSWELSQGGKNELVFGSTDDITTFDYRAIPEDDRPKAIAEFSSMDWQDLDGRSPWHPAEFGEVAKTNEEIALVSELIQSAPSRNAVAQCVSMEELLRNYDIPYGDKAVGAVSSITNRSLERHAKTITDVYVPIMSEDGKSAVLLTSRNWAALAGVGIIIKLERQDDGVWRSTRAQQVWIS